MPVRDRMDSAEKEHFHYVNLNPKGRHTADCVIRAMALFFGWEWTDMMKELCAFCTENGYVPNYKSGYGAYLICQGITVKKPEKKMTVKEFLDTVAKPGFLYLVATSNHMTCIKDGKINDTWDCSNRPVKHYWQKRNSDTRTKFYSVIITKTNP